MPRNIAQADAKAEARTTFEAGVEASRAQRWDEARDQFRRSLQLLPKASTMFNLAVADIKLGLGREALEQLDAFEDAASSSEHAQMLERARVLRPQAQALVDSAQAKAQHGGNVLSKTDDGFTDEVRRLVQQAREDYARGQDREALAGFERAYKNSRRAELLYNIGVVADRLREDRRAARAYDQFVAALPDAREAAVAQVRSDALHAALEERERAGEEAERQLAQSRTGPVGPSYEEQARKPRALLITGGVMLGVSVVGLAITGKLMGDKLGEYNACLDGTSERGECNNKSQVRTDRALLLTGVAASAAVGAAAVSLLIAGGVKLARVKRDHRDDERAFGRVLPSLAAGPDGAMLTLQTYF